MNIRRSLPVALLAGVAALGPSCSGSSSPSGPITVASPATSPSPSPSPSAPASPSAQGCAYGFGTLEGGCSRGSAQFVRDVDTAIDRLVQQHPEYFNLNDTNGFGDFRVLKRPEYFAGVVANLQQSRFCAESVDEKVSLKNSSEFSESYDIVLSTGHVRRGAGAYRETCSPPSFPINPPDAIGYVRVAFYSIVCEAGITPPLNGQDVLPIGCRGFLTATPKRRNNEDVPRHIIGDNISWRFEQAGEIAVVHDDGQNAFNKQVIGRNAGRYTLCATSHGVEGCQHGEILPDPR
jgi:hypothetical protein